MSWEIGKHVLIHRTGAGSGADLKETDTPREKEKIFRSSDSHSAYCVLSLFSHLYTIPYFHHFFF